MLGITKIKYFCLGEVGLFQSATQHATCNVFAQCSGTIDTSTEITMLYASVDGIKQLFAELLARGARYVFDDRGVI